MVINMRKWFGKIHYNSQNILILNISVFVIGCGIYGNGFVNNIGLHSV